MLGARGKTGRLIVQDLLKMGKRVRAVSYRPFQFEDKVCVCLYVDCLVVNVDG